jgi:hypothetical protein
VSDLKKKLFETTTLYPRVSGPITLYEPTWQDHIIKRHVELIGKELDVQAVVANVNFVLPGTSIDPNYVVFINPKITTPSGVPLGVVVDQTEREIITAYYNRSFRIITPDQAIWLLSEKK